MVSAEDAAAPWLDSAFEQLLTLHRRGVHALLLHGQRGTGKWHLALRLTRYLLCRAPLPAGFACGACPDCRWFDGGHHPDARVVVPDAWADRRPGASVGAELEAEPAVATESGTGKAKPSREIKIDAIRALAGLVQSTVHRPDGVRVVLLAPLEQMNAPAANALLKNLEEPPPHTRFILVADRLDRCLPTVLSRCALVRVPVPAPAPAVAYLINRGLTRVVAERALVHAGGAPFAALDAAQSADTQEQESLLLGLLRLGQHIQLAQIVAQIPRNVEVGQALASLQRWCWDWMAVSLGQPPRYFPGEDRALSSLAAAVGWAGAEQWSRVLRRMVQSAEHPLNAKLTIEEAMIAYAAALTP